MSLMGGNTKCAYENYSREEKFIKAEEGDNNCQRKEVD